MHQISALGDSPLQRFSLHQGLAEAIGAFSLPDILGFGSVFAPVMFRADYRAGSMSLLIERAESRVAGGGIGAAKVGGNYACALQSAARCAELGYDLTLWLAHSRRNIEELSGMNFFAVVDGRLLTPLLSDSILAGVTRDSVIRLARAQGLVVEETSIAIDELLGWIEEGRCSECFACGTAAIVTPIRELGEAHGTRHVLLQAEGEVTALLRQELLDIQEGRTEDPFGWMASLPQEYQQLTDRNLRA